MQAAGSKACTTPPPTSGLLAPAVVDLITMPKNLTELHHELALAGHPPGRAV